jgi:hypothetical protein
VLGAPEGLDAEAGLIAAFEQFRAQHGGVLSLGQPIDHGSADYKLADAAWFSETGECVAHLASEYFVNVTFVELNATVEETCEPGTTVVRRDMTLYYGTLSDASGTGVLDGLSLSDHISGGLRIQIENSDVDPRARSGLDAWQSAQNSIEWALDDPEGLDAKAALLAVYAEAANGGDVVAGDEQGRGTIEFVLDSIQESCGEGQGERQADFVGRVHFVELNATIAADDTGAPGGSDDDKDDDEVDDVSNLPATGAGPAAIASGSGSGLLLVLGLLPLIALAAVRLQRPPYRRRRPRS